MAKASELPALNAAAATADQHIVLDVSDTTQGSGGSLKRQPANYLAKTAGDETTITGGGVIALGGHTLTVSGDGTAALSGHEHSATAITSGTLDDARIAESNVTQHQAALSVTLSQVSDYTPPAVDALTDVSIDTPADNEVLAYDTTSSEWINQTPAEAGLAEATHEHSATAITSGTLDDARIAESNVTQHQSALSVTESQITDLGAYAENIADLGDVTIASPVDGQSLVYNSAGSGWVNGAASMPPVIIPIYTGVPMTKGTPMSFEGNTQWSTYGSSVTLWGYPHFYVDKSWFPLTPTCKLHVITFEDYNGDITLMDLTNNSEVVSSGSVARVDDGFAYTSGFTIGSYMSGDIFSSLGAGGAYYGLSWLSTRVINAYLIFQWS